MEAAGRDEATGVVQADLVGFDEGAAARAGFSLGAALADRLDLVRLSPSSLSVLRSLAGLSLQFLELLPVSFSFSLPGRAFRPVCTVSQDPSSSMGAGGGGVLLDPTDDKAGVGELDDDELLEC